MGEAIRDPSAFRKVIRSVSEEARAEALGLFAMAMEAGDNDAAATQLLRLCYFTKWIGSGSEKPWIQAHKEYALKAWQLVEGGTNNKLKSRVLLTLSLPIASPPAARYESLEMALKLSEEVNDFSGMGQVFLSFGHGGRNPNSRPGQEDRIKFFRQALDLFEKGDEKHGRAQVRSSLALLDTSLGPGQRAELRLQAADFFQEAENPLEAARTLITALTFDSDYWDLDQCIEISKRAVSIAEAEGEVSLSAWAYSSMIRVCRKKGKESLSLEFAGKQDSYDVALYGSRRGRLQHDLEVLQDIFDCSSRADKKEVKLQIREIQKELKGLTVSPPD